VAELVQELNNSFWLRRIARVLPPTTAPKVTMPRRTARMAAFVWGSELSVPTADTALKFGTYNLTPHYITGEIEISNDLIRGASISPDGIVRAEINFRGGELEEQAFINGNGAGQPLGINTPDSNGVGTDRDTTADPATFEAWVDTKLSLREPYLRSQSLRWLLHRNAFRVLSKLKATTGEPIWLVNTRDGMPDTVLGVPTILSEYAPSGTGASNTYATGDYVGTIGDFGYYDIQDGLDVTIQVLTDSYYARRNMVGYIMRRKVDGCPRIGEAFARLKKS
jgi:HK97 family phage major capsid protein